MKTAQKKMSEGEQKTNCCSFALNDPRNEKLYAELFDRDRLFLFPQNTFPPNPKDMVALACLDDILDYLPTYYQFTRFAKLEPYQVCVFHVSDTMQRHASMYGFHWEPFDADGTVNYYLSDSVSARVEEIFD